MVGINSESTTCIIPFVACAWNPTSLLLLLMYVSPLMFVTSNLFGRLSVRMYDAGLSLSTSIDIFLLTVDALTMFLAVAISMLVNTDSGIYAIDLSDGIKRVKLASSCPYVYSNLESLRMYANFENWGELMIISEIEFLLGVKIGYGPLRSFLSNMWRKFIASLYGPILTIFLLEH
jgi:hypothetical protein